MGRHTIARSSFTMPCPERDQPPQHRPGRLPKVIAQSAVLPRLDRHPTIRRPLMRWRFASRTRYGDMRAVPEGAAPASRWDRPAVIAKVLMLGRAAGDQGCCKVGVRSCDLLIWGRA